MEKITDDELEEIAGGISAFDSIKQDLMRIDKIRCAMPMIATNYGIPCTRFDKGRMLSIEQTIRESDLCKTVSSGEHVVHERDKKEKN